MKSLPPETLVGTPDEDWQFKVFSPVEVEEIEKMARTIIDEHAEAMAEPISVITFFTADEFRANLLGCWEAAKIGCDVQVIGLALADEYYDQDTIPPDAEMSEAANYFKHHELNGFLDFDEEGEDDDDDDD